MTRKPVMEFLVAGRWEWSRVYVKHPGGWYTVTLHDGTLAVVPPKKVREPKTQRLEK